MSEISQAHPRPKLHDLICPRPNLQAQKLLATDGMELTFNARGALLTAFEEIGSGGHVSSEQQILMPAFHCPSAITPALMAGLIPVFYRIRPDLSIDWEDVATKTTSATSAILIIHFFGAAPNLGPLASMRSRGLRVVEDCSHAFVSVNPMLLAGATDSEYRVFSFWKLAPSGVGGGLLRAKGIPTSSQQRPNAPLKDRLRNNKQLLEEAIQQRPFLGLRAGFNMVERVRRALRPIPDQTTIPTPKLEVGETYYPVSVALARAAMPAHARRAIETCDLPEIVKRRRHNFERYLEHLHQLAPMSALMPVLGSNTCPWVFPVRLPNRDSLDYKLRDAGMALHTFGIYLHSKLFESTDSRTISDARLLAQTTLCLAIHQDISSDQIDRGCSAARPILGYR